MEYLFLKNANFQILNGKFYITFIEHINCNRIAPCLVILVILRMLSTFILLQSSHMQQKIEELAVTNQELKEKRKKNAAKRKSKEMEGNEVEETEN